MLDTELTTILIAAVFFGIVLGMQESIYRAAVSEFAPVAVRGRAYGIFNAAYGVGFLISGSIYGLFIDYKVSIMLVLLFVIITQASAITALLRTKPILREEKR